MEYSPLVKSLFPFTVMVESIGAKSRLIVETAVFCQRRMNSGIRRRIISKSKKRRTHLLWKKDLNGEIKGSFCICLYYSMNSV